MSRISLISLISISLISISIMVNADSPQENSGYQMNYPDVTPCRNPSKPRKLTGKDLKKLHPFNKNFLKDTHMPAYEGYLVYIKDYGRVTFYTNSHQFLLIKDNKVIYKSQPGYVWTISELKAVSFYDLNRDGFEDITLITTQMTGMGPTGAQDFPVCYIFMSDKKKGFYLLKNKKSRGNDESDYLFDFNTFGEVLRFARKRF